MIVVMQLGNHDFVSDR